MHITKQERDEKIRDIAYKWYQIRILKGVPGTPEGDWKKAEEIVNNDYPHKITLQEGGY